jgi:8-oxo-dGTP pyrophosphatase MutT (NUDIX family)
MKMLPSGGHIEVNELPLDAAQRELQEEIWVSLPLYRYSQNKAIPFFITVTDIAWNSTPHTDVSLRYIFEYDSSKEFLKNDEYYREYHGHKRFTFDEILSSPIEKFDEHMHRFTRKLQQHITKKQEWK